MRGAVTSSLIAALFLAMPAQAQMSGQGQRAQQGPGGAQGQQGAPQGQGAQQGQRGQQGGGGAPAQQRPAPAEDVSDEELDQFTAAVAALQEIKGDYSEELGQAGDRDKAREIQSEMQEEMRQAIKDEGLSIQRYVRIGEAVKQDSDLNEKVQSKLE